MGELQQPIFEAMARPDFYPHGVEKIRQRQTHISRVFLTGRFVYKVKKAVDLEFLDFTTLEKRRHFCRREVSLNRRLAADVYLDVVPITREKSGFVAGGDGEVVEYAVKMRQLPDDASLLRKLQHKAVNTSDIKNLARILAHFYETTARSPEIDAIGSWDTVRYNCEENFRQSEPFVGDPLDGKMFAIVRAVTRAFLQRNRRLFQRRVENGKIRDCHGDLRSGHVYFTENGIAIIDCIEFNDRFRFGDVASDLAFLAMDLDYEGFGGISGALIDAYVRRAADKDAFTLLEFYKCYRAMVRAKVACLRAREIDPSQYAYRKTQREARRLLELAYRYAVAFNRPTIWVVCGLPAAGKSTLAAALAEALQCRVLRSDVVRKKQFAVDPDETVSADFQTGIYSREATALTYGKLTLLAQEEIGNGKPVILDATFGRRDQRLEITRLARDCDADYIFVECRAPLKVLEERLRRREHEEGVSDARLRHLEQIRDRSEALDDIADEHRITVDTRASLEKNLCRILKHDYAHLSREISQTMGL
jgi:aminoglycoside phosphotransferase family enzyme/predicted kinase